MTHQELLNRARYGEVVGTGHEQIEALQIELEAAVNAVHREQRYSRKLEADAERYRKLRPLLFLMDIPDHSNKVLEIHACQVSWTDSIDAAVDALPNPEQECQSESD